MTVRELIHALGQECDVPDDRADAEVMVEYGTRYLITDESTVEYRKEDVDYGNILLIRAFRD